MGSSAQSSHLNSVRHSPDIMGFHSQHYLGSKLARGQFSSAAGGIHSSNEMIDIEARTRHDHQQRSNLHGEVAAAKQRYLKKVTLFERQLDQARSEKRDLQHLVESQKHSFKLQLAQQDQKTQD